MPNSPIRLSAAIWAGLILFGSHLAGQGTPRSWISTPVLGLFTPSGEKEVRAIVGVPGASTISAPIVLPQGVTRIHLGPTQRRALVEQPSETALGLLAFAGASPGDIRRIDGAMATPDLVSFSPTGRSAVLLSNTNGQLQVLTALDGTPRVAVQAQVSDFAPARFIAVNDEGTIPVIVTADGSVYVLREVALPILIFHVTGGAGACFLPNLDSMVIAEGSSGNVTVIDDVPTAPSTRIAASGLTISSRPIFVQASLDARWLFVTPDGSTSAFWVDLLSGEVKTLGLPAISSRLDRLRNGELFLLSTEPTEPVWLLLGDSTGLRTVFAAPATGPSYRTDRTTVSKADSKP
jgi:hypothetical protein